MAWVDAVAANLHEAGLRRGDRVSVDFAGTDGQQAGNVNGPITVTRSAVYFVVRAVCDPDIPASGGAYAPVEVTAPVGSLVNAGPPGGVVAGNTETSSRIVDVVMNSYIIYLASGLRRAALPFFAVVFFVVGFGFSEQA